MEMCFSKPNMCPKPSWQECQPLKVKKLLIPGTGGQSFQISICFIDIPCCSFLTLLTQLCDGTYDCPQTETSDGGEDENDCEGTGDTFKHCK